MPSTLEKRKKQISKKRNGVPTALHEKSRDSMRLHKASVRDQRLDKLQSARMKREQPIVDRVAFFQDGLKALDGEPLDIEAVQGLISTYIHSYDEEYDDLKKARRPGRPASAREDLLKMKIDAWKTEYDQGFCIPDVMDAENLELVKSWEGTWTKITSMTFIKVTSSGQSRKTDFPSKGLN